MSLSPSQTTLSHVTVLAAPLPVVGKQPEPQVVELQLAELHLEHAWYDERPATANRESITADAHRLHKALTAKVTNYGELIDVVSGKTVADLQNLRARWKEHVRWV